MTRQVLKVTGSGTTTLAGDGTIIEAMSSRFELMREEALQQALAQAQETLQPTSKYRIRRIIKLSCCFF